MPDIDNRKLDEDALMNLLGKKQDSYADSGAVKLPAADGAKADGPVSTTMPIGELPPILELTGGKNSGVVGPNAGATSLMPAGMDTPPDSQSPAITPQILQGFTPKYAMEGFNFGREQNTGKSAKDAFAYLANQAPPPPLNDKAALQQWTEQYIVPGMKQLGHDVSNVNGDTFHLKNWQGDFDVDYGRGAGADGGALAWQVQEPTAQLSNGSYQPKDAAPNVASQEPSSLDQILAEVQALQNGQASPMDADALMKLLQP